jgi:D-arabinose 1-dehydrogenase-like Zn-dependent alcohol dehydrogenase
MQWPRVPGHEVVGDIVAVHPSVTKYKIGQRVGAGWQRGSCGTCRYCVASRPMGCEQLLAWTTGKSFQDFKRSENTDLVRF